MPMGAYSYASASFWILSLPCALMFAFTSKIFVSTDKPGCIPITMLMFELSLLTLVLVIMFAICFSILAICANCHQKEKSL